MQEKNWCVYILECKDGSYYTGVSNNLDKRIKFHQSGKGSKYVRARGFLRLLCSKNYSSKSEALREEYRVKQLPKNEKLGFLSF